VTTTHLAAAEAATVDGRFCGAVVAALADGPLARC
jgi:hypothetical protein